jgi:molybdenum cofactor cytidylyltransferase
VIAGIFLAAGEGRRFGGGKLLRPVAGMPLYYIGLSQAAASRLSEIRVVTGPETVDLKRDIAGRRFSKADGEPRIHVDHNPDAKRGMMSSLKTGLAAVEGGCDAAMVLLADMPLVTAIMINTLIDAFEKNPSIVIPECAGRLRHPRVIPARLFPEFMELADDEKGTKIIDRYREETVKIPLGNELNYIDVDTPEDLDALEQL